MDSEFKKREDAFKLFQNVFQQGLFDIEKSKSQNDESNFNLDMNSTNSKSSIDSVVDQALSQLKATPFAKSVMQEKEIEEVHSSLSAGIEELINAMQEERYSARGSYCQVMDRFDDSYAEAERDFLFWGRIGVIFYYFRDCGYSLTNQKESEMRKAFPDNADAVINYLESLLSHVVIEVIYSPSVILSMKRVLADLKALDANAKEMLLAPIESDAMRLPKKAKKLREEIIKLKFIMKERPLAIPETGAKPLREDLTIIRRQFIVSVCRLCFEIFGHIDHKLLNLLLQMKSTSASDLGLLPWLYTFDGEKMSSETRKRELRRYIKHALDDALLLAKKQSWISKDLIEYFAKNREIPMTEDW